MGEASSKIDKIEKIDKVSNQKRHNRHNLTKIWETSRYVFVRLLLGLLRTYRHQIWQGGPNGARKNSREVRFHGNCFVTM